ncbi:hypothetical protein [Burkholderia sp. JP2-270]|uniref:sensor histidine kinase n=1 Tax=Burkholderia sp. JP2-270 TaxID=2217913 RepID=UPI0013A6AC46|nr:hypothetical protein [Burkholderia sp. JP2-270]
MRWNQAGLMDEREADSTRPDFRTHFESAPGLYPALDPELRVVAMSGAHTRATRMQRDAILGHGILEIFPDNPDDPDAAGERNLWISVKRVLQTCTADAMAMQKNDIGKPEEERGGFEVRYWSPLNAPVLDADGHLACIIHRVEDVTGFMRIKEACVELAQLAASLREHATRMEAEVFTHSQHVERTRAGLKRANEEVARLDEKTKEQDELNNRFFANISQELRAPFTLIRGPVARLLHVNDLLDIARLDVGRMLVQYTQRDLPRLPRVTASHVETVAADLGIGLPVTAPPELPAQVDTEKVERILLKRLSNAFKFSPSGGEVGVRLDFFTLDAPGVNEMQ